MGVRPGYKQTEVGVIPEAWVYCSVGELISTGLIEKPLDGNHGNIHPKSGDFVERGIPFIMAKDVHDGRIDLIDCSFIRKEQADSLQKGFARTDDILLTHKATIGNTAIVGEISSDYIMLTPQVTYYRVADSTRLINLYLLHYFNSAGFQSVLRTLAGGGTRAYIGIKAQHQLPVVLPPLPEQRAIAEALSDVDALLGALDRLIAKKRDIKQATMQQLLAGRTRLPGFRGEWDAMSFGNLVLLRNERVDPRICQNHGYCIELENIGSGSGQITGKSIVNEQSSLKSLFYPNDVLFCKLRAYLRKYWLATSVGLCSTEIWVLKPRESLIASGYLFHIVTTNDFIEVASTAYGTHMPRSDWQVVKNYSVMVPSLPEQTAIAEVLSDMDAEIVALERRREKTRAIKQGMMQELLTGRTRLVPTEAAHG